MVVYHYAVSSVVRVLKVLTFHSGSTPGAGLGALSPAGIWYKMSSQVVACYTPPGTKMTLPALIPAKKAFLLRIRCV